MYKTIIMRKSFYLIIAIIGFFSAIPAASQNTSIECMYEYRFVADTNAVKMLECGTIIDGDSTKIGNDHFILRCGGNVSFFYSYDRMVRDSVRAANKQAGKRDISGYKGKSGSRLKVYKDFENNTITLFDGIFMDWFKVVESSPLFEWNICDEWKELNGYKVRKATCDFRGRKYEAWYATDIPVSDGPWKFCGLPGLIFEVYDHPCQYYYCLTGIKQKEATIDYPDIKTIEVTMKKFNSTKRRYLENPAMYTSNTYAGPVSFVDKDGKPIDPETLKKKMSFDFQEIKF